MTKETRRLGWIVFWATMAALVAVALSAQSANAITWEERTETARFKTHTYPKDKLSIEEARLTVKWVARIKGFSFARANCIAERESGYRYNAYNSYSGASGIFQHLRRYWDGRVATYGPRSGPLEINHPASPFNGRANIIVSGAMMARGMWGHWTTDAGC